MKKNKIMIAALVVASIILNSCGQNEPVTQLQESTSVINKSSEVSIESEIHTDSETLVESEIHTDNETLVESAENVIDSSEIDIELENSASDSLNEDESSNIDALDASASYNEQARQWINDAINNDDSDAYKHLIKNWSDYYQLTKEDLESVLVGTWAFYDDGKSNRYIFKDDGSVSIRTPTNDYEYPYSISDDGTLHEGDFTQYEVYYVIDDYFLIITATKYGHTLEYIAEKTEGNVPSFTSYEDMVNNKYTPEEMNAYTQITKDSIAIADGWDLTIITSDYYGYEKDETIFHFNNAFTPKLILNKTPRDDEINIRLDIYIPDLSTKGYTILTETTSMKRDDRVELPHRIGFENAECEGVWKLIATDIDNDIIIGYKEIQLKSKSNTTSSAKPIIGMSKSEVIKCWGNPQKKNITEVQGGTHEQWVYSNNRYVYFDNDVVTGVQYSD